jgi:addiction module RelE/StbE family toxin
MQLEFSKEFDKQFKKLNSKQQLKVENAIKQFVIDKSVASLRLHALKGEWKNHFSISAGGDLRIHLKYIEETNVLVVTVGTHSQLYK